MLAFRARECRELSARQRGVQSYPELTGWISVKKRNIWISWLSCPNSFGYTYRTRPWAGNLEIADTISGGGTKLGLKFGGRKMRRGQMQRRRRKMLWTRGQMQRRASHKQIDELGGGLVQSISKPQIVRCNERLGAGCVVGWLEGFESGGLEGFEGPNIESLGNRISLCLANSGIRKGSRGGTGRSSLPFCSLAVPAPD